MTDKQLFLLITLAESVKALSVLLPPSTLVTEMRVNILLALREVQEEISDSQK